MDLANRYTLFVGTARGTFMYSHCIPNAKVPFSLPDEQGEITAMEFGRTEDEILIGYKNEKVHLFNSNGLQYTKTISDLEGEGAITGLAAVKNNILIAKQEGIITIWNEDKSDYFSINLEEKGTLNCMVYNKEDAIGTGGECNDFKLWNVESQQNIFKAKSLGHDELNLPIPTSVRGIAFMPEHQQLAACATKEGHVLLYDPRAQRKPVVKFHEVKASYTCIASGFRERQCLVGTTKGYMQLLDLRKSPKCLKTFTAFTGSVTSIACDPMAPIVATTSLDRYLKVHNLETKEIVYQMYLKQNLMKILMKPIVKEEKEEKNEEKDKAEDEEYEELFDQMETVSEIKASKNGKKDKRKSIQNNNESEGIRKKKKKATD